MNTYSVAAQLKAAGTDKFISDFNNAANSVQSFVNDNNKAFESMRKVGKFAMAGGLAVGAGLGIAVKTAADFESSMSQVKAISGATGDEFNSLRDKAIEMGNKTVFSASESADAMSALAQMGWDTDQIMGGIEHTLNLAAAGGLELADSATITANTMNQFGLEAEDAERVADVFAYTASNAGTDVTQMADAMQYAGSNAAAAGMSIEDTAAFIGVLGDAGITGSKAGTALNGMLRDLKKNSEDGAVAIGDQSVALYDAEGKMRPMPDVIGDIARATEGMSNEQRDAALSAVFGDQALAGFNAVAGQGADSVSELSEELSESKGTAEEMADVMQDNLNGSLTELGSAFEGVMIAIGTALIPVIEKAVEVLKSAADWFNDLSETAKNNIGIFLAVSSVVMTLGGAFLILVGSLPFIMNGFTHVARLLGMVRKAMVLFNTAILMNPIAWLVAAIVAAAVLIYVYWEPISEFFINLWEIIKTAAIAVWDVVMEAWMATIEFLKELWAGVSEFFMEIWESIKEIFMVVWEPIQEAWNEVIEFLMEIWEDLSEFFSLLWEDIKETMLEVWEPIQEAWGQAVEFFTDVWESIKEVAVKVWDSIVDVITSVWDAIVSFITPIVETIKSVISTAWNAIQKITSTVMNAIKSVITSIWNVIKTIITTTMNVIKTIISTVWNVIKAVITTVVNVIKAVIQTVWNVIKGIIQAVMSAIQGDISGVWNAIKGIISSVMSGIMSIISSIWNGIRSVITSVVNGIRSVISSIFNSLRGIVTGAMSGVRNAVSTGIKGALKVVTGMGSSFKEAGGKIISMIADGIKGAASKVTGAAKDLMGKVRNLLPFSPAKDGPLTDLHQLNFGGTIADSIRKGRSLAVGAMDDMMESVRGVADPGVEIGSSFKNRRMHNRQSIEFSTKKQPAYINVAIGNQQFDGFVEDITEVQSRKTTRLDRFRG